MNRTFEIGAMKHPSPLGAVQQSHALGQQKVSLVPRYAFSAGEAFR
jgi:hypothetical protein